MKKVININFQGRVLPIEEAAYEALKQYIESLRRHFLNEEGREEIINDIESRIAELFEVRLRAGASCITESDLDAVIDSIGRPEDFGDEEERVKSRLEAEGQGGGSYSKGPEPGSGRRFFRTEDDKVIAGVCGGIAAYVGIDVMVVRIALLVLAAAGFGFGVVLYLVLWAITPSTASRAIGAPRKRLMRDPEDKLIGGVCRGLAWYFGVNVWVPRLLFLLPFISIVFQWSHWHWDMPDFVRFSFSPAATIIYIVLWLALPEAISASDRLEMRGEPVNLDSIRANFTAEMKGVEDRIKKFGREAGEFATQRGRTVGRNVSDLSRQHRDGLSGVFALLLKIFVYFILAIVLFAVISSLFGLGVATIGLMPLRGFVLDGAWQDMFAWGTLLLFIWVPVVGIITTVIRRLMKAKRNRFLTAAFTSLWLLGLACLIGLIVSVSGNFRYHNTPAEERIPLTSVDKLTITSSTGDEYFRPRRWLQFEPFAALNEDTLLLSNVRLRIVKAASDSFGLRLVRSSHGSSRAEAAALAAGIEYPVLQQDSQLILPKGIPISRAGKFRNQFVYLTVAVPVGKRIEVRERRYDHYNGVVIGRDRFSWDDDFEEDWDHNVEYIMTEAGLRRTDGRPEDRNRFGRYDGYEEAAGQGAETGRKDGDSLRELRRDAEVQAIQRTIDSLNAAAAAKRRSADTTAGNR